MNQSQRVDLTVANLGKEETIRLDLYLTGQFPELTRSRIQKLIDDGNIIVLEEKTKAGEKVKAPKVKASMKLNGGEEITVFIPEQMPLLLEAENIPLDVVYEDEHLIVINKPAGMVTHPGAGIVSGTLVNALLYHCQGSLSGISGVLRPGIVHRLDKDTSGLLVVAKGDQAHQSLAEQIRKKTARRVYFALLEGALSLDAGIVDKPIGRHPTLRKQMAIVEGGRRAVSHFETIQQWHRYTLVKVTLETGRTHQIRIHMASLGYPIVGDIVYNRKQTGTVAQRHKLGLLGHALHATQLSFIHPITESLLEFVAPLPPDFQRLLDSL